MGVGWDRDCRLVKSFHTKAGRALLYNHGSMLKQVKAFSHKRVDSLKLLDN